MTSTKEENLGIGLGICNSCDVLVFREQNIPSPPFLGPLSMMVRKREAGNPADYFDKTFAEYQEGFAANGVLKNNQLIFGIIFQERAGLALTTSTD